MAQRRRETVIPGGPNGVAEIVLVDTVEVPDADVNRDTLYQRLAQAEATNASYLATASPTNAANAAQLKALTRQVNALMKLALGALDNINGT